jgi:hypothetical protein
MRTRRGPSKQGPLVSIFASISEDMGSNFFEGKGDYIVYGSHTGQSNNTLTQYSSEQDADIILKLDTNNNLSQYLKNWILLIIPIYAKVSNSNLFLT